MCLPWWSWSRRGPRCPSPRAWSGRGTATPPPWMCTQYTSWLRVASPGWLLHLPVDDLWLTCLLWLIAASSTVNMGTPEPCACRCVVGDPCGEEHVEGRHLRLQHSHLFSLWVRVSTLGKRDRLMRALLFSSTSSLGILHLILDNLGNQLEARSST